MRINQLTSKAMDVDVEKEIKEWLTFATERERMRIEEAAWYFCVIHCINFRCIK